MATKRALETRLAVVVGFDDPRAALEQYPTPPDLAAHIVHVADLQGDIEGRTVVDLGSGTGMLTLGAALRGPARVVGFELDASALATAQANEHRVGSTSKVHWVQGDADRASLCTDPEETTVVMNPPFGAQKDNVGADREFLATASDIASVSYSVHNAGSKEFVEAFAADEGGTVTHAFRATFAIDRQFDFHEEERREIDAEVFRIEWTHSD